MTEKFVGPTPVEVTEEDDAQFRAAEEQAERDAEREIVAHRVNLRWSKNQVDLIRRAAAIYGIPYQSYLKQAAVRQAVADIKSIGETVETSPDTQTPAARV